MKFKGNQIFWVCPLIVVKKLDHSSAIQKYNFLKKFPNKVSLLHGKPDEEKIKY